MPGRSSGSSSPLAPYLQVAPLAITMIAMVGIPLATVVMLSFWESDGISIYPAFTFDNYREVLSSPVTVSLFLKTLLHRP